VTACHLGLAFWEYTTGYKLALKQRLQAVEFRFGCFSEVFGLMTCDSVCSGARAEIVISGRLPASCCGARLNVDKLACQCIALLL